MFKNKILEAFFYEILFQVTSVVKEEEVPYLSELLEHTQ